MEFYVFFLQMPFGPTSRHIHLVDKGFGLEQTEFDFRHMDLDIEGDTEIVENCGSIADCQNIIVVLNKQIRMILLHTNDQGKWLNIDYI